MDACVHARVSLSFVSSVIFQRQRATPPRCDVKSTDGAGSREETGRENIAAVTTPRVPANIFPTKIESGSIRVYVIGSVRPAKERENTNPEAERDPFGREMNGTEKEGRIKGDRKAAFPTNGT